MVTDKIKKDTSEFSNFCYPRKFLFSRTKAFILNCIRYLDLSSVFLLPKLFHLCKYNIPPCHLEISLTDIIMTTFSSIY